MAHQTQVVLTQDMYNLGTVGEVVTVKPGYARNYLIPQGFALRANKTNLEYFEARKAELLEKARQTKEEAITLSKKIDGKTYTYIAAASERDMLYGAVTPTTVADLLAEQSITVNKISVQITKPIKVLGLHDIRIVLHNEVTATITLNIARNAEEAKENLVKAKEELLQPKDDLDVLNISPVTDAPAEAEASETPKQE